MATMVKITPVRKVPTMGAGSPLMGFGSQAWNAAGVPKRKVPLSPGNMAGQVAKNTTGYPASSIGGVGPPPPQSSLSLPTIPPASDFIPQSAGGRLPLDPAPVDFAGYLNEATTNPMYTGALAAFNTGNASARAGLGAQIAGLITQGGYDLSGKLTGPLQSYAGDITPDVLDAASKNQLSQRAQIEQSYNRGLQGLVYELAARGTLGSGAQATGTTGLKDQALVAHDTAQQNLLNALTGNISNYEQGRSQGQSNLDNVLYNVASMLAQQPGQVYTPGNEPASDVVQQDVPGTNIPSAVVQPTNSVQWGPEGRVFTTKAALASYLAGHGANYTQWAISHPSAAAKLR